MSAARSFTELKFWQRARVWSRNIFHDTQQAPFLRDQRLVVQINDSSESVMANMAEGLAAERRRSSSRFWATRSAVSTRRSRI